MSELYAGNKDSVQPSKGRSLPDEMKSVHFFFDLKNCENSVTFPVIEDSNCIIQTLTAVVSAVG